MSDLAVHRGARRHAGGYSEGDQGCPGCRRRSARERRPPRDGGAQPDAGDVSGAVICPSSRPRQL
ncbi:MAG: hypothetical protein ABSG43_27270, partial [Solirubrobacteraceae bacterium]